MAKQVEAVYENGVLRPLEPLPLQEHQHVTVMISEAHAAIERTHMDMDYLAALRAEVAAVGPFATLDEIRKMSAKDTSSLGGGNHRGA